MKYHFEVGKRYACREGIGNVRFFTVTERNMGLHLDGKKPIDFDYDGSFIVFQMEDTKELIKAHFFQLDAYHSCEKIRAYTADKKRLEAYADTADDIDPTSDWTWREREEEGDCDPEYWAIQDAILNGDFA